VGLSSEIFRPEPRATGILPAQEIRALIRAGKIGATAEISEDQIQPATLDLRLGKVAYRVQASFLPGESSTVDTKIQHLKLSEIDLGRPALLEKGAVFIVPLMESLALPGDTSGKANPKSTTGRLDIFTRLITDAVTDEPVEFERVPKGYSGSLYVEIVSRTFPIVLKEGARLTQVRFVHGVGNPSGDGALTRLAKEEDLVFENGDAPAEAVVNRGLRISIDLEGDSNQRIIGYRAKKTTPQLT